MISCQYCRHVKRLSRKWPIYVALISNRKKNIIPNFDIEWFLNSHWQFTKILFLDCKKNNVIFSEILSSEIPNLEDLQSSEDLEIADLQSSELSEPFDLQSSEEDFTPTLVLKEQYIKVFFVPYVLILFI